MSATSEPVLRTLQRQGRLTRAPRRDVLDEILAAAKKEALRVLTAAFAWRLAQVELGKLRAELRDAEADQGRAEAEFQRAQEEGQAALSHFRQLGKRKEKTDRRERAVQLIDLDEARLAWMTAKNELDGTRGRAQRAAENVAELRLICGALEGVRMPTYDELSPIGDIIAGGRSDGSRNVQRTEQPDRAV